ncbi:MAG TPA: AMP-binding protein [Actinomycetota bacterium]|nr:AMP-binding protein [Actinomycetota bacterium]
MPRLIAVRLPPGVDYIRALESVWGEGDAILPLDPGAPEQAVHRTLLDLRPHLLIDAHGHAEVASPAEVPEGTAAVISTSGTTGAAKGAVLSHAAMEAAARMSAARLGQRPDDRWLCALPLNHVAGLMILVRSRLAGTPPAVHAIFDPDRVAAEEDVTLVSVVPTMLARLLDHGVDLSRFRAVLVGGARPPGPLLERARRAGVSVVHTYGMTETCGGVVYDGVPLDGVEVSLSDDDEVLLRGPMLFSGYRRGGAITDAVPEDGWFRTRDLGRLEADGRLTVVGRVDDVIVTGGEKVAPGEVEAILLRHPAVADVEVVGRPDPQWGEKVVARVVPEGEPPSLDELRTHVKGHLPGFAAPRGLEIVEALGRSGMGKIRR